MHQQRRTLLLVDGDIHRAERLAARLSGATFDIRFADNGAVGLLRAHDRHPDAIITAADLPVLDGYRMIDALRSQSQTCGIPVILLTEGNSPSELARGWTSGADLCIPRIGGEAEVGTILNRALPGIRQWEKAPQRERSSPEASLVS